VALALYRKYRPASFAQVVGQDHVTEPLRTALAAGRINHAYLFSGPRGCGKTSSARILARSLNCAQGPTPDPCGACPSCVALAPEGPGSIDVVELDAASHGGVDDARDLRDRAFYAPAESRYRVFIIDEAHMVTTQGFNALLKIVEEPPEHLVFVFATTEPEKVLATIRSRTHHYPFRLLPPSTMRGLLEQVCAGEGVTIEPAVYPLVILAGGGSARDSLSVLDQLTKGFDGGDELALQMLRTYLSELPGRRLRLQTAVRQAAPRRIVVAADGLRAASLTIGAMGIARVCGAVLDSVSAGNPDAGQAALVQLLDACQRATEQLSAIVARAASTGQHPLHAGQAA